MSLWVSSTIELQIPILLRHCTFEQLRQIHAFLLTSSLARNPAMPSLCIRRAAELGNTAYANVLFSTSSGDPPHILLWNALIRGSVQAEHHEKALNLFALMHHRGLYPNEFTYQDAFSACSALRDCDIGKKAHCLVIKAGFALVPLVAISLFKFYAAMEPFCSTSAGLLNTRIMFDEMSTKSVGLWNRMVAMYVGIGDVTSARKLFDSMPDRDVVSWNTMLSGYARAKDAASADDLFHKMPERNVFSWTAMVGAFARGGNLEAARRLFDEMPERNPVSWNCMLSSYTQKGEFKMALDLFFEMQSKGFASDGFTFVSALSACAHLGALDTGKWIHFHLIGNCIRFGAIVGTALVEMYAKCGDIDSAFRTFIKAAEKDVFCWNVMIKALAAHGMARSALDLFARMRKERHQLNDFTFMSVLFACSHGGLVEEGRRVFVSMEREFGIKPRMEHYGCLVDLLCRAGLVEDAYQVVKEMPYMPDVSVWGALLGGCGAGTDVSPTEKAIARMEEIEDNGSGVYVTLSNMYAASGLWAEASSAREKMRDRRIWKAVGCSSVVEETLV